MTRALLVAVLAVGLVVRLGFALSADRPLVSDERDYDALAWTLATTATYSDRGHATAYRPVGYPAFVASIYATAGRSPRAVRVAQSLLDTATALLLYIALRRRSARAGLLGAAVWSLYPPAIVAAALLYPEALFGFLSVLVAVLFLEEPRRGIRYRVALGVLLGALVLVKTTAAFALPFVPWLVLRGDKPWRRAAVLAAGALLVILPWTVRNARAVGMPVLATSSATNLLIGNHPNATGGYATDVPPRMRPRSTGEAEAAREASRAAWRYIADRPGEFLARIPARWAHLLMGEGELAVIALHPAPGETRTTYREKVKQVGTWKILLLWVPYAVLLLGGIAGLLTRDPDPLGGWFVALLLAWLLAHGATFGGGRHHAPWMPFFAAVAAERLAAAPGMRPFRGRRRAAWFAVAMLCLALWIFEGGFYL